jgi:hypothetical protein
MTKINPLRVAGIAMTCVLSCLAACSAKGPEGTPAADSPVLSAGASPTTTRPLSGHLLFSRWDETANTFASHHVSLADGSEES